VVTRGGERYGGRFPRDNEVHAVTCQLTGTQAKRLDVVKSYDM